MADDNPVCLKEHHTLRSATALQASGDGQLMYLRCYCGRQRVVPVAVWEAAQAAAAPGGPAGGGP